MKIKLSRHANNRLRLYEISIDKIENAINFPDKKEIDNKGNINIWKKISGLDLKIVYTVEKRRIIVITVIPL